MAEFKICPCCNAFYVGSSCQNCCVHLEKPEGMDFDPDDFMGEYEEENDD